MESYDMSKPKKRGSKLLTNIDQLIYEKEHLISAIGAELGQQTIHLPVIYSMIFERAGGGNPLTDDGMFASISETDSLRVSDMTLSTNKLLRR